MVEAIERLARSGHTYTSEGSVYFRIANFPAYGKLSHNDFSGNLAGARVDVDEYDKDDARDSSSGRPARKASLSGTPRSAPAAPAGTSSAPSWR